MYMYLLVILHMAFSHGMESDIPKKEMNNKQMRERDDVWKINNLFV